MAGKPSRDKGQRGEREAARLLGAVKISRMYQPGPDLVMPDGRHVEIKRRKNGWKELYKWLGDDSQLVAMRADRREWLIAMTLDTFLDILEEHENL